MDFTVSDVKTEKKMFRKEIHLKQFERLTQTPLESVSKPKPGREIIYSNSAHQLVSASWLAFAFHYPLVLSPDAVWVTIAQGLANHINLHAEDVRKKFVAHQGKAQIVIRRDEFVKGSPDNHWEGAFAEFSERIKGHIGPKNHEMIVSDFSTTGAVERAASEVVLMDAMQSYFEYGMMTCCGIPHIELTGKTEDWEKLFHKIDGWVFEGKADLSWWTKHLRYVLGMFLNAAKGNVDKKWWESFFKENSGHGSGAVSKISGWINWLFPYIQHGGRGQDANRDKLIRNPKVGVTGLEYGDGLTEKELPSSLSKVPFEWNYNGTVYNMELLAGVSAVVQNPDTFAVEPNIGWGVRDNGLVKKSKIKWR